MTAADGLLSDTKQILEAIACAEAASWAERGELQHAENLLKPLAQGDISSVQTLDLMGRILAQQGRYAEARGFWKKAQRLQPSEKAFDRAIQRCDELQRGRNSYVIRLALSAASLAVVIFVLFTLATRNNQDSPTTVSVPDQRDIDPSLPVPPDNTPRETAEALPPSQTKEESPAPNIVDGQNQITEKSFKDISSTHWAYNAVEKIRKLGIVEGYPDATYKGSEPATRYEMAQTLNRLINSIKTHIKDTPETMTRPPAVTPKQAPSTNESSGYALTEAPYWKVIVQEAVLANKELRGHGITVEQSGEVLHLHGQVPNLWIRYLAGHIARSAARKAWVDLSGLQPPRFYTVRDGDNLSRIAQRLYGNKLAWKRIADKNKLRDPNELTVGQQLTIPEF